MPKPRPEKNETDLPSEAREMAEDAVREMTGEDDPISERDETMNEEEAGGPFVETDVMTELGDDEVGASWTREPTPKPMRSET